MLPMMFPIPEAARTATTQQQLFGIFGCTPDTHVMYRNAHDRFAVEVATAPVGIIGPQPGTIMLTRIPAVSPAAPAAPETAQAAPAAAPVAAPAEVAMPQPRTREELKSAALQSVRDFISVGCVAGCVGCGRAVDTPACMVSVLRTLEAL